MYQAKRVSFPALLVAATILVGCGDASATDDLSVTAESIDLAPESDSTDSTDSGSTESSDSSGGQTATLTLDTGEVIEFTPTTCENQNTDPNDMLNDDFVDLFAKNDDGLSLQILNARFAGSDPRPPQIELAGDRDENGVNPKISYVNGFGDVEEFTTLNIDGRRVTGETVLHGNFSSDKRFGDQITATYEFNC